MSRYCFLGTSYAARTLAEAARRRGLTIIHDPYKADLIFVSEDTQTDAAGHRDMSRVLELLQVAKGFEKPIVLTSQVEPGFCRKLNFPCLYHQAETLRIEDGIQRGMHPEMFVVGTPHQKWPLVGEYLEYLEAFDCPTLQMTYEDAEFCKIAINAMLIAQVEATNMLSAKAEKVGADWGRISRALRHDSRIGKYAYLTPGRWQDSIHLLRDYVTLDGIKKL